MNLKQLRLWKSEKQVGKNTKIPSCWSLFTMTGTEKSSAVIQQHNKHISTGQFSFTHCKFDTFSMKIKWGWECDGACTLSPSLCGGVCVCEGSLKQYYTRRLIISERRHQLQTLECVDGTQVSRFSDCSVDLFQIRTGGTWAQSTQSHFAPSPCVIKCLLALPSEHFLQACCVPRWACNDNFGSWAETCDQVATCLPSDTPEIKNQSV